MNQVILKNVFNQMVSEAKELRNKKKIVHSRKNISLLVKYIYIVFSMITQKNKCRMSESV